MDDVFRSRLTEWAQRSWSQSVYCFSHFLTLAEQSDFLALRSSLAPAPFLLFGGTEGCERRMLRFGSEDTCGYDAPFPIRCLRFSPLSAKFAENLTHRDYLGALMALGVERETLGDIVVRKDAAYLFCEERMAPYLMENFAQARRTALQCEMVEALPEGALFETRRMQVQVSSQRADALIAHVFRMSRSEAQALFPAGKVFVSGRLCESPAYAPKNGDILSVRGYGRVRYLGVESLSKKGKENTLLELFV